MYLIERSGSFYYKALFIIFVLFVTRNIYIAEQLICGANKNFKHCLFFDENCNEIDLSYYLASILWMDYIPNPTPKLLMTIIYGWAPVTKLITLDLVLEARKKTTDIDLRGGKRYG